MATSSTWRETRIAVVVFALLAVVHTWPLATTPATRSLNHNSDAQLNAWILTWIAHAVATQPGRLFDGNIFAPERATLAYSDPLVVPALVGAPVAWLGGSAVLVFNLVLVVGLVLTALAGWWMVWRWTGSRSAALVAGALTAFNVHLLTRLPHTAASHLWGPPLVLYAAVRLLEAPGRWPAAGVSLAVAATAATSVYSLALAGTVVGCVVVVGLSARHVRAAALVGLAALGGLALASPVLLPYARFAATGAARPLDVVAQFDAEPLAYVTSTSRLHAGWSSTVFVDDLNVLFAGVGALVLAGIGSALLYRRQETRQRLGLLALVAVVGVFLSFGPHTSAYVWLYDHLPPLRGIRAPVRFAYLYLMVVAILAGHGAAWLIARAPRGRRFLAGATVLGFLTIEALHAPIVTTPFQGVPRIYDALRTLPEAVTLVEVPFWPAHVAHDNGEYVLNATAHWRPLMNGYSGFTPQSYRDRALIFWYFPRAGTVEAMRDAGATHLVVHLERFEEPERSDIVQALAVRSDLKLLASDSRGHRLYDLFAR